MPNTKDTMNQMAMHRATSLMFAIQYSLALLITTSRQLRVGILGISNVLCFLIL